VKLRGLYFSWNFPAKLAAFSKIRKTFLNDRSGISLIFFIYLRLLVICHCSPHLNCASFSHFYPIFYFFLQLLSASLSCPILRLSFGTFTTILHFDVAFCVTCRGRNYFAVTLTILSTYPPPPPFPRPFFSRHLSYRFPDVKMFYCHVNACSYLGSQGSGFCQIPYTSGYHICICIYCFLASISTIATPTWYAQCEGTSTEAMCKIENDKTKLWKLLQRISALCGMADVAPQLCDYLYTTSMPHATCHMPHATCHLPLQASTVS